MDDSKVFVIIWLGFPKVFSTYDGACDWLRSKVPSLSEIEIRFSIYLVDVN